MQRNYRQSFEFTFTSPPKKQKPLTAKNYRRIAVPPNIYRRILVYRFRQSRYRRKMKNPPTAKKLPPYRITAEKYRHVLVYRFRPSHIYVYVLSCQVVFPTHRHRAHPASAPILRPREKSPSSVVKPHVTSSRAKIYEKAGHACTGRGYPYTGMS